VTRIKEIEKNKSENKSRKTENELKRMYSTKKGKLLEYPFFCCLANMDT
jgi:hypothetical protein